MTTEIRVKINRTDVKTSAQEVTRVFSESLKRWRDEEPRKGTPQHFDVFKMLIKKA
jgi:hypothetical protein